MLSVIGVQQIVAIKKKNRNASTLKFEHWRSIWLLPYASPVCISFVALESVKKTHIPGKALGFKSHCYVYKPCSGEKGQSSLCLLSVVSPFIQKN